MQKALLDELFSRLPEGAVSVNYWDGTNKKYGEGSSQFTLSLTRPLSTTRIARHPLLELGEAYMDGIIDVDEDLSEVMKWAFANQNLIFSNPAVQRFRKILAKVSKPTSLNKQKQDVQFHYDLGNEFYSLWLDETMSYSCAYFHSAQDTLKEAQLQKIDHILKKLQLQPGETLLDIGSGWGWLIIRAAQQYQVSALGITLSQEQYQQTKKRIAELKLEHLVEVELLDYRDLATSGRTFDKVASVGMLEHVGKANLDQYMTAVERYLNPGGLALIHSITHLKEGPINPWLDKHIFPGGYIPSLREVVWLLPDHDLHLLDIESLRMHYAMTLDYWAEGFEMNLEKVRQERGERFVRKWRLYLRSCAESFRMSGLSVHQILVSKGLNNNLPLTRHHLYQ
ncbi:MAG TPA: cyclopropane-fatty-acyl-phospholipid synthase family protein [Bacillota bacterium]|nr:cyclopropane-fatty-acyl-phospholipid synthase family protein [Bacillota bacterium]